MVGGMGSLTDDVSVTGKDNDVREGRKLILLGQEEYTAIMINNGGLTTLPLTAIISCYNLNSF